MEDPEQVMRNAGRYVLVLAAGSIGVFSLFWVMQFLVASGQAAITGDTRFEYSGTVDRDPSMIHDPGVIYCYFPPPEKPVRPQSVVGQGISSAAVVSAAISEPEVGEAIEQLDMLIPGEGDFAPIMKVMPDFAPIMKVMPVYPRRAQSRGLEGYCDLEFAVTPQGATANVRVIECSSPLFKRNSVQALRKFTYKPRVVDGTPIAVPGLRHRFTFEIEE